jgi:transcriptional regulator with XRE-family HTH domain
VKVLRETRGLRPRQLADRSGLCEADVVLVESGGKPVLLEDILRLAQGLGISPAVFFERR